jgi:hypothetical protein
VKVDPARTITLADMPDYPPTLVEAVDRILADIGAGRMLFTYRAIEQSFGISRATVSRRVKDGLVPGVRIANGRVMEEGPVRRFDRPSCGGCFWQFSPPSRPIERANADQRTGKEERESGRRAGDSQSA